MSSNTSGAPCYTCAHGSMCNIRDQYMKFFEHRDEVMCKVGYDGSTDNTVDTSNEVRINVEHRYMNGPGLDDLYARLGLAAPTYCCMVPQNRCPLHRPGIGSYDRDYFDSPIMNKWNAPLGYISSICEPDKWEAYKYNLPYKKPFIPMDDPCRKCYNAIGEKPRSAALIAGTPYSTFAVTTLMVRTGTTLESKMIDPPNNIMANYSLDVDTTPATYVVEGEDTRVILYYRFIPKDQVPPVPGLWIDDKAMEEKGLMHNVAILYGNRSAYTYRPFKKNPDFTTIPEREQVKLRILSVRSAYNRLSTRYSAGAEMHMTKKVVGNPPSVFKTSDKKHVQYIVDQRRDSVPTPFIPADSEYVELRLAQNDIIDFEVSVQATHNLFFKMMDYLDCAPKLIDTHFGGGRVNYHLQYTVEDTDKVLHMCLINLDDKKEFTDVRIDYPDLNTEGIHISPARMTITIDNGHEFFPLTKLAPRAWNNVDEDHMTWACNLPTSWAIDRKGFRLSGFVDALNDAIGFDPTMDIKTCEEYGERIFRDVHFVNIGNVNIREHGYSTYAKWEIDFNSFYRAHEEIFDNGTFNDLEADVYYVLPEDKTIQFVPYSKNHEAKSNLLPSIGIKSTSITEVKTAVLRLFREILNTRYFNAADFSMKLAKLPKNTVRVFYQNGETPFTYTMDVFSKIEAQPEPDEPEVPVDPETPEVPENPENPETPEEGEDLSGVVKDDGFIIPDEVAKQEAPPSSNPEENQPAAMVSFSYSIDIPEDAESGSDETNDAEPYMKETSESEGSDETESTDPTPEPDPGLSPDPGDTPELTNPEIPDEPETPSAVPSTPLTPAEPGGDEIPAIPLNPPQMSSDIKAELIQAENLEAGNIDILGDIAIGDTDFVMLIEPARDRAFFMNPKEFTFLVQPIHIDLAQKPIKVSLVFDCEPAVNGEGPGAHLLDVTYEGLDPMHQAMIEDESNLEKDLLHVEFDEENGWDPYLVGELSDYYYISDFVTSHAANIIVKYAFRDDVIKTEKWRVPGDHMVKIKADITSTGLFFKEVKFKMKGSWRGENLEYLLLQRDESGKISYRPDVASEFCGMLVHIHSMWDEEHPNELTMYFDAKNDVTITVELMREQLDPNAYCARCAGYVDTNTDEFKTWLKWVPDCLKYTPLH